MADPKKDAKKEAPKSDYTIEIIGLLVALVFLGMIVSRIEELIAYSRYGSYTSFKAEIAAYFFNHFWPIVKVVATFITIISTYGIIHNLHRLNALKKEEAELYNLKNIKVPNEEELVNNKNEKWVKVIEHINSPNSSDWRLAIIEADIMLEELMRAAGYHGESLGEMLKSVEKSDFTSIESAWEAHKVRNRIAHAGSDFLLNEREAKMTIAQFEEVFKEFKII